MKLRPSDSLPDTEDPFKDDLLERRPLAERLVPFLANVEGPFTIALTGPCGSGKTHFLRRCKVLLERAGVPIVLINAWETDFASEPLAPIISELADKFSEQLPLEDRRWKKAKSLAAKIAAASVPIGLKLATAGILKAEDLTEAGALGNAVEKMAEKQFERFAAAKKSVEGLKKELRRLTTQIRDSRSSSDDDNAKMESPPVIVFIDELDRCRPSYSIELLEVVKHFFEIPGIVFVLAVDRSQIVSAAKAVFGFGLDGDGYLRKFIDLECSLPTPNVRNFCLNMMASQAIIRFDHISELQVPVANLCSGAGFTLRRTQQFVLRAAVAIASGQNISEPEQILFLVFLREFDSTLYEHWLLEKVSSWELLLKLRELDSEFGYPTQRGGAPFLDLLAALGKNQRPKSFMDLLEEDYQNKGIESNLPEWLRTNTSGAWRSYLQRLTQCVDFCTTFAG
jgi:hypothetical protein